MTSCSLDISTQQLVQDNNVTVKSPQQLVKCTFTQDSDPFKEREFFVRCLVFGAEKTGKHALINGNFPNDKTAQSYIRNDVDFLNRTHKVPYNKKKYHFWTFRVNDKSLSKEALWRAYYKSASAFVFVYDVNSAESFKRLERTVQSVLSVVPKEEFYGVLVGNKSDLSDEREVSYDAAVSFQMKYGMAQFYETSQKEEEVSQRLLKELDPRLKMTFESI